MLVFGWCAAVTSGYRNFVLRLQARQWWNLWDEISEWDWCLGDSCRSNPCNSTAELSDQQSGDGDEFFRGLRHHDAAWRERIYRFHSPASNDKNQYASTLYRRVTFIRFWFVLANVWTSRTIKAKKTVKLKELHGRTIIQDPWSLRSWIVLVGGKSSVQQTEDNSFMTATGTSLQ